MPRVRALLDALDLQLGVVGELRPDDLARPSRCDGWTVRQVIGHSLGVTRKFADFASGATAEPHAPPGDLVGRDHRAAARRVVADARLAWHAADLGRTCRLPFGTFPADLAAGINLFDVLAHTWDIAAADGVGVDLDRDGGLWSAGLDAAREVIGPVRDPRHYAAEVPVPPTAPAMHRFLGFVGRDPTSGASGPVGGDEALRRP